MSLTAAAEPAQNHVNPADVLAGWMADEARVLAVRHPEVGVAQREQLAGLNGLMQLQAMIAGHLPPPPIALTLDFTLVEVAHGRAVFQGQPLLKHYNPLGTVHGGWFGTLLDSALGCAVHSAMELGQHYTTLEYKVNLVRALTDKVPRVRAIGTLTHLGRQTATAEARLVGHDGRLYAHASTTCIIFNPQA
ncbi:MAG: PaaI family thioesterase [Burkholderiaceae bacterium]|nr:PaaI family thioesterase [Burkholderiaceae bacterium]